MTHPETSGKRAPAPVFAAATIVIFFLSLSAAESVGFVPCYVDGTECAPETVSLSNLPELGTDIEVKPQSEDAPLMSVIEPERIVISAIDLDLPVQNPETRGIDVADRAIFQVLVEYADVPALDVLHGKITIDIRDDAAVWET